MFRSFATLLVVAMPAVLSAHVEVPSDFRDVVGSATLVVRGHVTDVRTVASQADGAETVATIAVDAVLKGAAQSFVDVHVPGGVMGRYRYAMTGAPTLRRDEEAFFFLTRLSDNTWHLVKLGSGLFVMHADATGQRRVESPVVPQPTRIAGAQPVVRGDARRPSMTPDEFSSLVRLVTAGGAPSVAR